MFKKIARNWRNFRVTVRAAIVGGVFAVLAATSAAVVTVVLPRLLPPTTTTDPRWVTLYNAFVGFNDGMAQYPVVGCPNGEFFMATPEALREGLPQTPGPIADFAYLGPLNLVMGIDTNLPAEDSVAVTDLAVVLEQYEPDPRDSVIVVRSTVCADADSGDEERVYRVVLDPSKSATHLLLPGYGDVKPGHFTVKQGDWSTVRLEFVARKSGWYKLLLKMEYRYRGEVFTATLPEVVRVHFLADEPSTWMRQDSGDSRVMELSPSEADQIRDAVEKHTLYGFPPVLADSSSRSGRL